MGFPVRADTAVRPYAENLSLNRHSRFRATSCRGRLPRLPARHDDRNAKRAGTEACPYEWPVDKRKALTLFRWTESVWFPGAGGHGGPTLHGGLVFEQAFQVSNEASVGAGFHDCQHATMIETPIGQAQRPAPTSGRWKYDRHLHYSMD